MKDVAAIVVTYNRKDLLKECLRRLMEQRGAECDIVLIDNASTDGTYEELLPLINEKKIIYFNTEKNLGGAGGFQYGIIKAAALGYKYAWLMDDDTYVKRDSLEKLLSADKRLNGNYGFLSSVAYWKDGSICNMNRQKISLKEKVSDYRSAEVPVIMATFVSFFVKMDVVKKVGLPIKEFFIWSDDLEYTRRISRQMPCYMIPESKVLHYMGSNNKVGIESESEERLWRYELVYRNEMYLYRREGIKGQFYMFSRVCFHILKVLLKAKESKLKKIKVILKSFNAGFKFKPEIEYL